MTKRLIMGNEAIALGAVAAGVRVVTGYPGTPSTEVLEAVAVILTVPTPFTVTFPVVSSTSATLLSEELYVMVPFPLYSGVIVKAALLQLFVTLDEEKEILAFFREISTVSETETEGRSTRDAEMTALPPPTAFKAPEESTVTTEVFELENLISSETGVKET